MKKILSLIITLFILLPYLAVLSSAEVGGLSLCANSAILADAETGKVLFEKSADKVLPMASTTKIMTALVAIENCPLEKVVTVDDRAVGTEGSSVYLQKGEKMTMEDLVYSLLLQSANDAAAAIAFEISGSIEGFAGLMNKKAESLGLKSTHFTNPHGLDDDNHHTTARELMLICAEALKNKTFAKAVSTVKHTVSGNRTLVNHNRLLRTYDGCIGVKTGFTKKCGRCLVSAAKRNGTTLICVTLNDPDDWNDHRKLFDFGFSAYDMVVLSGESGIVFDVPTWDGKTVRVKTSGASSLLMPSNHGKITVTVELPHFFMNKPDKGKYAGIISFFCDGKIIKKEKLYAE